MSTTLCQNKFYSIDPPPFTPPFVVIVKNCFLVEMIFCHLRKRDREKKIVKPFWWDKFQAEEEVEDKYSF